MLNLHTLKILLQINNKRGSKEGVNRMFKQESFSPLWEFENEIRNGELTLKEARNKCQELRNKKAKKLRKSGFTVKCFTLRNQLREYWEMGIPCELSCDCFFLNCYE